MDMSRIPARFGDYIDGSIQAALTAGIATGIATFQVASDWHFFPMWATSWLLSWLTMLPVVIFIAPYIRRAVLTLTAEPEAGASGVRAR